jgi:hypothetical protein
MICRFAGSHPASSFLLVSDNAQYVDLNVFDLIAAVFYRGILTLNMAF